MEPRADRSRVRAASEGRPAGTRPIVVALTLVLAAAFVGVVLSDGVAPHEGSAYARTSPLVGATVSPLAARPAGNGNSGNNSSNPFSDLISSLGGAFTYVLIAGIIGFVTWILLIVGIWVIAVVLMRRLPKPAAKASEAASVPCAACSKPIPAGSKFCPECGTSAAPKGS